MAVLTPAFAVRDASGSTREHLLPLHKLDATTAPTVNDDSGDGYIAGSKWVDTTNDITYICIDNTLGAAVWVRLIVSGDTAYLTAINLGHTSDTTITRTGAGD